MRLRAARIFYLYTKMQSNVMNRQFFFTSYVKHFILIEIMCVRVCGGGGGGWLLPAPY